jgi:hypothetical protein
MGKCLCKQAKVSSFSTEENVNLDSVSELSSRIVALILSLNLLLNKSRQEYEANIYSRSRQKALSSKVQEYKINNLLEEARDLLFVLDNYILKSKSFNNLEKIIEEIEKIESFVNHSAPNSIVESSQRFSIPSNFPFESAISEIDSRIEIISPSTKKTFIRRKYFKSLKTN